MATPAAEDRALVGGHRELRLAEHARNRRAIFLLEGARIGRDAGVDQRLRASRRPRTIRARSASTSRARQPCAARSPRCRRRGGSSIRRPGRDDRRLPSPPSTRSRRGSGRSTASAAGTAGAARSKTAGAGRSSARNRRSAARPAGNCENRARRGGRRACRRLPPLRARVRRLPDQVERQIGKAKIDLQRRRMPAPFAQPLAEDQRVIAEPQKVIGPGVQLFPGGGRGPTRCGSSACALLGPGLRRGTRHQMCFTSSGMS